MAPEPNPAHNPETIAGLQLIRTDGIGPITYHGLVAKYGSAEKALAALPDISGRMSRKRQLKVATAEAMAAELAQIEKAGAQLVAMTSPAYPSYLKETSDAPPFLVVLGDISHLSRPSIGIVGARNASLNGKKMASVLGRDLAEAGYTVWSGLARGIDTAAHSGAVSHSTVAVMAGGTNVIYPKENTELHKRICASGAVVSEMPLGTQPQAHFFPRRNRIISGASRGVIVVEGTPKSGSLITARFALDQGRDVFAVPGSPLDPRAQGPNALIRDGAVLVRSAEDVLLELGDTGQKMDSDGGMSAPTAQPIDFNEEIEPDRIRNLILDQIGTAAVSVDELRRQCQVSAPVLAATLLDLELEGRIERLPGNRIGGLGSV